MTDFAAPTDDILFSLRHVAEAHRLAEWDDDLATDILGHFAQFAEGVLAPLNAVGDAQGAQLENGRVRMPDGFADAYAQLAEGGWQGLRAPERFGGMAQPALVAAGVSEIFTGANHAMQMVCGLVPGAIDTLLHFGTSAQQGHWIPRLASGEVLSTMCLTEAGAGSDLSGIRCKAVRDGKDWRLEGEKIFISGGDQDMSAGILHLVLARSGTVEDGLKGLSLYLCPAAAGVTVTRIEDKLGLHASPTCQMAFASASAELVGTEGDGLRAMFTVMNHARLDVSLQGVAHAARAAQIARAYADERVQGRRSDGTPALLSDHADVQRMLDEQASLAIGARAMCHIAFVEMERAERPDLVAFLTPLCKVFCSEAGIRAADLGIQILGGYGYLNEYQLGQVWRDARITSIYEGANGIHERSLATRGLKGAGADQFEDLIRALGDRSDRMMADLADWAGWCNRMRESDAPERDAHAFVQATARLFFKACWVRCASVADHHPQPDRIIALSERVLSS
ncbi:acyl-CoA dehydrogenase [Marivita lacus]|uniref:Acyl-CoA dehydrogenase n=1 Tax=Marivita lacus TaxID=1323742 RepID=A0ABQ1KKQ0_9RHOB|nr:acyl-CoA dehydrogenase family protein [Marivita lacus]GGB99711.1 acyl-CoA dehydrogenase [Marivita lacus]